MELIGFRGEVRVAYHTAFTLGSWSMRQDEVLGLHFTLHAKVIKTNEYWSTQGPFDVHLEIEADVDWIWKDAKLMAPGMFRASGVPQIEKR